MDRCPSEVLHQIYALLEFKEVASLRRVCQSFADIGAEHLITQVRFHCSEQSLDRLQDIANHPVISQHITSIIFEGNILADIACEHRFAAHYDEVHHRQDKPQPPSGAASNRERRLYERNLAKFDNEVKEKYKTYRLWFNEQQQLLTSGKSSSLIGSSVMSFPKLEEVRLSTVGRCRHVLSERFIDQFALDCSMPMDPDTAYTKTQLRTLIFPNNGVLSNLKSLDVHVLSPKIFTDHKSKPKFIQVFESLKRIDLNFRLENDERNALESGVSLCYDSLSKGMLRDVLAAARDLCELSINFDDFGYYGPCIDVKAVLGETTWPKLKQLDLDCMTASKDFLVPALARQPALRKLRIGFFTLENGLWEDVIESMQKELSLDSFLPTGILDDPQQIHSMHYIDSKAFISDFVEISATELLDMFVCEAISNDEDGEGLPNPLKFVAFDDRDDLREEYGSPSDSDFDLTSDMDCD